jgi:hypothetical protein
MQKNLNWTQTRLFGGGEQLSPGVSSDGLSYYSPDALVYPVAGVPATVKRYISGHSITLRAGAEVPPNSRFTSCH